MSTTVQQFAVNANAFIQVMRAFQSQPPFEVREDGSPKDLRVRTVKGDADILPANVMPVSDEWVSKSYQYIADLMHTISNDKALDDDFKARRKAKGVEENVKGFWSSRIEPLIDAYCEWNRENALHTSQFWASEAGMRLTQKKRDRMVEEACAATSDERVAEYANAIRTGSKLERTRTTASATVKAEDPDLI